MGNMKFVGTQLKTSEGRIVTITKVYGGFSIRISGLNPIKTQIRMELTGSSMLELTNTFTKMIEGYAEDRS